ncbi:MAG: hypothetical protein GY754_29215 [bacterium]|nr:hypothetical protein [bacterium]
MFKSKSLYGIVLLLALVMSVGYYGCFEDDEVIKSVSFVFTNASAHNGKNLFAKLVPTSDTDCSSTALYFGTAVIASGSATVTLSDVAADTYKGCAFIDVDSSSTTSDSTSMPNTNDYSGNTEADDPIVVDGEETVPIDTSGWSQN